jgi:hypothetical protein
MASRSGARRTREVRTVASDRYPFECTECDAKREFKTKLGGTLAVAWHYYREHPTYSFLVGNPLSSTSAPDPEDFEVTNDGE